MFTSRRTLVFLVLCVGSWIGGCADHPSQEPESSADARQPVVRSETEAEAPRPRGGVESERGGPDEAGREADELAEALELAPSDTAKSFQSISGLKEELFDAAELLLRSYPERVETLGVAAIVQWRFGSKNEAEALWEKALRLNDEFVDAYHGLGDLHLEKGEYDRAIEQYRKVLDLQPERPDAHHRLAEALIGAGEMAEAVDLLERRLEETPRNAETYFWLGQACLQAEDYEKAVRYHKASIGIDPENTYSYYGLATASTRLGRKEDARDYLEEFRRLKKKDRQIEFHRLENVNDYRTVASSAAYLWSALARVYGVYGDLDVAERYWLKARGLDPQDRISRQNLVSLYGRQQRLSEAVAVLEELCQIYPAEANYYRGLGVFQTRLGDLDSARTALLEAVRLDPKSPGAYATLAHVCLEAGQPPSVAVDHARKAVDLQPIAPHYMVLSQAASEAGNLVLARTAAKKAAELAPNNPSYQQAYEALQEKGNP